MKLQTKIALLVVLLLLALTLLADSRARIVRLSYVEGGVRIDRGLGSGYEKAIENLPVTQGNRLRTQGDGYAEVEFEDGTSLRMAPSSEIEFPLLSLRDSGGKASTVKVDSGVVYFNVKHRDKDEFTVAFADHNVTLTRSAHFRIIAEENNVNLAVFNGEVELQGPGDSVTVKKKETATFVRTGTRRYQLAKGIDEEPYDQWDEERASYQDTYAGNRYGRNAPYYGWSDLNYYGGWYWMPGYGQVWQPYNIGFGWSPFDSGAWCFYPGLGWTWVSTYPWGWLPYRYGSWAFIPGWGWAWQPGTYWTVWRSMPRVINPPQTFLAPTPPSSLGPGSTTIVVQNPRTGPLAIPKLDDGGRIQMQRDLPRGARVLSEPGVISNKSVQPRSDFRPPASPKVSTGPGAGVGVPVPRSRTDAPVTRPGRVGNAPRTVNPASPRVERPALPPQVSVPSGGGTHGSGSHGAAPSVAPPSGAGASSGAVVGR